MAKSAQVSGTDWTQREIDVLVADYFDMRRLDLAREHYVKAHRNRALQKLIGRSESSIEFKHQNVSAVLRKLGEPWIPGYKPMSNFQHALLEGVERFLVQAGDIVFQQGPLDDVGFNDSDSLYIGPAPTRSSATEKSNAILDRIVRKFDPAARDARNRSLGQKGEELAFNSERARLRAVDRDDLSRRVRWISEEDGDGAGYDILSFEPDGRDRLLEIKTTRGEELTPFFLSKNELLLSEERPCAFKILRVYDFARQPRSFEIAPPLKDWLYLTPTEYRAAFEV